MIGEEIRRLTQKIGAELHVSAPATIESFDVNNLRADVRLKELDESGNAPVIVDVPVMVVKAGGLMIRPPYNVGDEVQLIFSDSSLENLLHDSNRRPSNRVQSHLLDYAVVIGGNVLNSESISLTGSDDSLIIGVVNGNSRIEISPSGDILLGGGSLEKLVQATVADAINTHTHEIMSGSSAGTTSAPSGFPAELLIESDDITENVEAN